MNEKQGSQGGSQAGEEEGEDQGGSAVPGDEDLDDDQGPQGSQTQGSQASVSKARILECKKKTFQLSLGNNINLVTLAKTYTRRKSFA